MTSSAYGYCTVANLEALTNIDYSAVDSSYTDVVIEAHISQAERLVNSHAGQSFTGTIPDVVVFLTLDVASKLMHNDMLLKGITDRENFGKPYEITLLPDQIKLLQLYLERLNTTTVDRIKMWRDDIIDGNFVY